jgi:hypothetical protein
MYANTSSTTGYIAVRGGFGAHPRGLARAMSFFTFTRGLRVESARYLMVSLRASDLTFLSADSIVEDHHDSFSLARHSEAGTRSVSSVVGNCLLCPKRTAIYSSHEIVISSGDTAQRTRQSTFFSTAAEEAYSTYHLPGDGDLWPSCWADDDNLYTANGDGIAFNHAAKRYDMAVSSISGKCRPL